MVRGEKCFVLNYAVQQAEIKAEDDYTVPCDLYQIIQSFSKGKIFAYLIIWDSSETYLVQ